MVYSFDGHRYEVYEVAHEIIRNEKRMEKLRSLHRRGERYEKLCGYITATCRELKIKLTEEEKDATRAFFWHRTKLI